MSKKVFTCANGLRMDEEALLLYVQQAVQPSDAHFLTFLRTFDCIVALLEEKPFDDYLKPEVP